MRTEMGLRAGFARALKQRRLALGVSQEELADRAELHRTYVSALERALKSPSLGAIEALAGALGLRPHELINAAENAADGQLQWEAAGGSLTQTANLGANPSRSLTDRPRLDSALKGDDV
jgi:transcriptional regulator with XRE-family HTH domain